MVFSLLLYERTRVGERLVLSGHTRKFEFEGVCAGIYNACAAGHSVCVGVDSSAVRIGHGNGYGACCQHFIPVLCIVQVNSVTGKRNIGYRACRFVTRSKQMPVFGNCDTAENVVCKGLVAAYGVEFGVVAFEHVVAVIVEAVGIQHIEVDSCGIHRRRTFCGMRHFYRLCHAVYDYRLTVLIGGNLLCGAVFAARLRIIHRDVYAVNRGGVLPCGDVVTGITEVVHFKAVDADIRSADLTVAVVPFFWQERLDRRSSYVACGVILPGVGIKSRGKLFAGGIVGSVDVRHGNHYVARLEVGGKVGHTGNVYTRKGDEVGIYHPLAVLGLIDDVAAVVAHKSAVIGADAVDPDAHIALYDLH